MPPHKPNILVLSLIGAVTIAFGLCAVAPGHRRLSAARAETHQIESAMMAQAARIVAIDSLVAEVRELSEQTAHFDAAIPSEPDLGGFLTELTAILERNGLENQILQPRPARPAAVGEVFVQPVTVQCEGRFESLFNAWREVELMNRLTQVERLHVRGDPEHPGRIRVEASLNVYYRTTRRSPEGA